MVDCEWTALMRRRKLEEHRLDESEKKNQATKERFSKVRNSKKVEIEAGGE